MSFLLVAYALTLATLLTGAQVLFKFFAIGRHQDPLHLPQYLPLAGALGLYFAVFVIYAHMLRSQPLTLLYPVYTALTVVLTYGASLIFFRETLSIRSLVGVGLLIIAIYLIATPSDA